MSPINPNSTAINQLPYQPQQSGSSPFTIEQPKNIEQEQRKELVQERTQGQRDTLRESAVDLAGYRSTKAQVEAYAAGTKQIDTQNSTYAKTNAYVENYNQFSADVRRSNAINSYVDNGGDFERVGERASTLPINQIESSQQEHVRHVGMANQGQLQVAAETQQYSLEQTTRAIESYNLIAQSSKEAQNHATYLQNSMTGLNTNVHLGSA